MPLWPKLRPTASKDPLSARNLARFGLRRGAYTGSNRRRFVLFVADSVTRTESAREFDTKGERDAFAVRILNLVP